MSELKNIEELMWDKKDNNSNKHIPKEDKFLDELPGKIDNFKDTYIYVKTKAKYYWVEKRIFFSPNDICNNLNISLKELRDMRSTWIIEEFNDITYQQWGKKGCYNLLDECIILEPSSTPTLHPHIKELVENVCWHKQENIEYLHKAILYKHSHINDFTIPAIVFYGHWGSGKGTIISLLGTIFWEGNILANLWQRDLTGSFDTYKGQKLIVEFAEIATHNTHTDISVLNKLKNIIWAEKINVNEKGVKQYQTENIAWFFISSNSNKPLQLDDKDKGNRRFTIIKSNSRLENGKGINETIRDEKAVADYLAWLYQEYPDVPTLHSLEALDNEDKRELEERSQNEANQFWDWLEGNFPDYTGKRKVNEINEMINLFCIENDIEEKEFKRFFWNNSKYPKKRIRLWEELAYWVIIPTKEETDDANEDITIEDVESVFW